jgi:GNAT superfamily N-acetyltransferase
VSVRGASLVDRAAGMLVTMPEPEPRRTVQRDRFGTEVFTYIAATQHERRAAYDIAVTGPGAPDLIAAVDLICQEMSGWIISGPAELGVQLADRGGTLRRSFHIMRRQLAADPPPVPWSAADLAAGRRAVRPDRDPRDVFPAWRAAYPDGHPDTHPGTDEEALTERLVPLLAGREGPILECSRLVVEPVEPGAAAERVVAGAIVIDIPGTGPWLADVFRQPGAAYAGLGTALLRRVLWTAAGSGLAAVGLSVTEANPARRVYERLGFEIRNSYVTALVP